MVFTLLYDLQQHCPSAAPRMYVDDLALISSGQSMQVHAIVMQVMHRLQIFCSLLGLKINVDKNKLLLKRVLSPADHSDTHLQGEIFESLNWPHHNGAGICRVSGNSIETSGGGLHEMRKDSVRAAMASERYLSDVEVKLHNMYMHDQVFITNNDAHVEESAMKQ